MNKKNVSCKNINWQWFPRLAHAWDVLWYDIVSVDQIAHGKCDCRTVILAIIFYRSLVSESSVTGLGVYTRRWVYDNITPHSLCYLARVRPVLSTTLYTSLSLSVAPYSSLNLDTSLNNTTRARVSTTLYTSSSLNNTLHELESQQHYKSSSLDSTLQKLCTSWILCNISK